ncbi:PREDICTED: synaptic vesicle glycoprotein 2A-like, partial [Merops nubicus]|uniref:synaptic vesicle glycoprotein 2A-like n=1 Tax=Merops nubicus TaxID=57421 RepID=UPI0004F009B1
PFSTPTDLFEYKFINSRVVNSTFLHNKEGCQLDFSDDNNAYMIYFVSFLGTLAVLPGNIVSALLMDKIGRLRMLGGHHVYQMSSAPGSRWSSKVPSDPNHSAMPQDRVLDLI